MTEITAYIGLGSNLDDPQAHVTRALTELDDVDGCHLKRASSLYVSPPMGPADQPDYVNAIAEVRTQLRADKLLEQLQRLENKHQRERTRHWGPRTLDLDLLLYGDAMIETDHLSVPHPGIAERAFVLYPLAELDSSLVIPGMGKVETLLLQCPREGMIKIEENNNGKSRLYRC